MIPLVRNDVEADMGAAEPGDGPGHEQAQEAREYARRLRSAPVDQVVGDALLILVNAAQVKLGRRDARLLIDVAAVAHEHARAYLPGELTGQVDQVLGQLRLAQVRAEGQSSSKGEPEQNDLDRIPGPPSAAAP